MSLAKDVVTLSTELNFFISVLNTKEDITIDKFCDLNSTNSLAGIIWSFCKNSKQSAEVSKIKDEKDEKDAPYEKHKLFLKDTSWDNDNWNKNDKQVLIDVNIYLDIRGYYIDLVYQLKNHEFRSCLKSVDILCKQNFDGNFLGNKIDLSGIFKKIKEKFMLLMEKLKAERAQARKNKVNQAKALKNLKDLENHLKKAQMAEDKAEFLDDIDNAYDELCLLAELDFHFNKNKDKAKAKGLANWYNDYNPDGTQEKDDKIDAILAIGESKYITKSFFGLFDMSKRLKLVRKYLPKIKTKWEGFQKQDKDKK